MPANRKLLSLLWTGLVAIVFVQLYLKARQQNMELGADIQDVVVAATDIPPNKVITPDMLTTKGVSNRDVEPGAFRSKIPGNAEARVIGKMAMSSIEQGDQILNANLIAAGGSLTSVSPMLSPGKRGYPLRLGNLDVAKLIVPGDHIDILATFSTAQPGQEAPTKITYTILQNILVAAVDKDVIQGGRDVSGKDLTTEGRLLTLMVDPIQAEKLAHAVIESAGEISVIVRAQGDDEEVQVPPVTASNILDQTVRRAPAPLRH